MAAISACFCLNILSSAKSDTTVPTSADAAFPFIQPVAVTPLTGAPAGGLTLWYQQPALYWEEALPVGNGRLGAMVFGGVSDERLQLNEDTVWAGGPYDPSNPGALEGLKQARVDLCGAA